MTPASRALRMLISDNPSQKKLTDALQAAIFNSASFSCIACDTSGVIQIFNVGAERMLGYAALDVVAKLTFDGMSDAAEMAARAAALSLEFDRLISPGFEALVYKASHGIEDIYELTQLRKDGSPLQVMLSVTALRDEQQQEIGYLLIGTDNTARSQVEAAKTLLDEQLRYQQFYTRSLIESNVDALMATDPQGIISDVNQQMEALTGCSREQLIGGAFKDHFTDPQRAQQAIMLALEQGKVTNYELTARARDGRQTVVSYNATTFHDRDQRLQGVFAAARDITERKQFEQALQSKNRELQAANAVAEKASLAKSDFLSSMSHELRSPLNAVLGFAQVLASEEPPPSAEQKVSIDQILHAGWYLLRLINEILDLSMIESGKVSISQESLALADVMLVCEAMTAPQAQQHGIRVSFPSASDTRHVLADSTRLKQVMLNLLSNAIKYNRKGGAVIVTCEPAADNRIRISVRDTGDGLSTEQLEQLFQPFNRLGREGGAQEGTGIGLVVTRRLVELMDGTIGVHSAPGIGSVFWVELAGADAPRKQADEDDPAQPTPEPAVAHPASPVQRTVLCIEDNPANLALVEKLVSRRSDLRLLTAVDAETGIVLARQQRPDLILLDINLPGLSGFGALAILRRHAGTAGVPVIALSANAVARDIEKGLQAGFFRYLTKPIRIDEFMSALDLALSIETHE